MIEVFPEKDYNVLVRECAALGLTADPRGEGMLMREGGAVIGAAVWTVSGVTADICAVTAPDSYGPYYDLLFRSALNHLLTRVERITVQDVHDFYMPLGFTKNGSLMTAEIKEIKFPHNCR